MKANVDRVSAVHAVLNTPRVKGVFGQRLDPVSAAAAGKLGGYQAQHSTAPGLGRGPATEALCVRGEEIRLNRQAPSDVRYIPPGLQEVKRLQRNNTSGGALNSLKAGQRQVLHQVITEKRSPQNPGPIHLKNQHPTQRLLPVERLAPRLHRHSSADGHSASFAILLNLFQK